MSSTKPRGVKPRCVLLKPQRTDESEDSRSISTALHQTSPADTGTQRRRSKDTGSRGRGPLSSVVVVVTPPALTKTYPTTTHHGGTTSNPLRVPWRGTSSITKPLSKSTAVGAETHSYSCRLSTKSHCKTAFQKKEKKKKRHQRTYIKQGQGKETLPGDTGRCGGMVLHWERPTDVGTRQALAHRLTRIHHMLAKRCYRS